MLEHLDLAKTLLLDIETVPQYESYAHMPDEWKSLWDKKAIMLSQHRPGSAPSPEEMYARAGIYAEFGKIACISVGRFVPDGTSFRLTVESYCGVDERAILNDFCAMADAHFDMPDHLLCAHNGREFDFPYLSRRCVIHGLPLPRALQLYGRKPWEVQHLDTMDLWKFGDHKSYTSLELLAAAFGIPTPKDDIDGSMVREVYWKEKDLARIARYCEKDVVTVAQLLLRFRNEPLLTPSQIGLFHSSDQYGKSKT